MNKKIAARKLGKDIRRQTGVKLPVAMLIAKKIIRGRGDEIPRELLTAVAFSCGISCCGLEHYKLSGPKGELMLKGVWP